jgi:hypothetical protein
MAQTIINNALEQTNLSLGKLSQIIDSHGDLILTRWTKKSKDKRSSLLSAASNLPLWLRAQDLIEDRMKLISLLNVRTTSSFSAEDWSTFDIIESGASFDRKKEQGSFSSEYVGVCGTFFGRVVDFELDAAVNKTILDFPLALYIFRTQNEIAEALLTVVDVIVADAEPSGNKKWSALMNGGLYGVGVQLESYQDAGFMLPVKGLDTDALLQTCLDKRDQMADEVELLQTDPEYTRDYILALKADIRWDANVSADLKWEHVVGRFATEAIAELNIWHDIVLTCKDLQASCQYYENATAFQPGEALHPDVFLVLTQLRQLLYDCQRFQWDDLYTAITQMHAAKDLYRMCSAGGKLVPCRRIVPLEAHPTPSDRIHTAFCDLATVMNVRHRSKRSQFNALADQLAAVQFDDRAHKCLSTLIELEALRLSVDWCQMTPNRPSAGFEAYQSFVESEKATDHFVVETRHAEIDPSRRESYEILTAGQPHPKWKPLGPLLRVICEHPFPKGQGQRGTVWLAKATEARHRLTQFWQTFRKTTLEDRKRQEPTDQRYPALVRDLFSFDVAPEYLDSVAAERSQIEAEELISRDAAASKQAGTKNSAGGLQQSTWGKGDTASNEHVKERPTKLKASCLTSEEELELLQVGLDEVQVGAAAEEPTEPEKVHIAVKQDSLSVFTKMFSSAGSTSSVRWINLVQALADASMTVTQKPGSGVKFTYGDRSVTFDKPHPEPVVGAVLLRRSFGRRLKKWFGWDGKTFVLREREMGPPAEAD